MWYLVCYEDDNNLRVLGREEIRHIFPDDDDDDAINVGDIVSAIWIPNGQFYDAKILQKGGMFIAIVPKYTLCDKLLFENYMSLITQNMHSFGINQVCPNLRQHLHFND